MNKFIFKVTITFARTIHLFFHYSFFLFGKYSSQHTCIWNLVSLFSLLVWSAKNVKVMHTIQALKMANLFIIFFVKIKPELSLFCYKITDANLRNQQI